MIHFLFILITSVLKIWRVAGDSESSSFWPDGPFGLPEPVSGCPKGGKWLRGSVYQNTEDEMNTNSHSVEYHLKGRFDDQGIEMRFCIKPGEGTAAANWPKGSYCILKYETCPQNFEEGEVFWQDEKSTSQIPNLKEGIVPDGIYNLTSTLIKFCCMDSGNSSQPILLPTEDSFYLFPMRNECQQVKNMDVFQEWIHFDDDDEGNTDYTSGRVPFGVNPQEDYNVNLILCYYTESIKVSPQEGISMKQEPSTNNTSKTSFPILGISLTASFVVLAAISVFVLIKLNLLKPLMN
ncbi:hypothetical protein RF11_06234 [Thelohanellus kitauei]|uniref:Apextrin C-terminal domain-containing protein n=1 Tax=Thelohanellus kitauei TaxID=669202 RepID=A0A0C2MPY7_THEKT|nr:hypothetical protein RF11_06234 [Thelohanellus kitauei]